MYINISIKSRHVFLLLNGGSVEGENVEKIKKITDKLRIFIKVAEKQVFI